MQTQAQEPTIHEEEMDVIYQAATLLNAVYTQISPDYKSRYRATIWQQVEENVAACARMTSKLHEFLSALSGKFQVPVPGTNADERAVVVQILNGQHAAPEAILQMLRQYPQVCVLVLRTQKDAEKAEREESYAVDSKLSV